MCMSVCAPMCVIPSEAGRGRHTPSPLKHASLRYRSLCLLLVYNKAHDHSLWMWPFEDFIPVFFNILKLLASDFPLPHFCQVFSRLRITSKSFLGICGLVLEHWIARSSKAEVRRMAWHLCWTYGVWSILVCLNSLLDSEYKILCQCCINCSYLENIDVKIKCNIVQHS